MSARAPNRADVQAKLVAALLRHGVVIKLVTGRMVVQQNGVGTAPYFWTWYGADGERCQSADFRVHDVAAAVLDQCGTRAVLAALEGEG